MLNLVSSPVKTPKGLPVPISSLTTSTSTAITPICKAQGLSLSRPWCRDHPCDIADLTSWCSAHQSSGWHSCHPSAFSPEIPKTYLKCYFSMQPRESKIRDCWSLVFKQHMPAAVLCYGINPTNPPKGLDEWFFTQWLAGPLGAQLLLLGIYYTDLCTPTGWIWVLLVFKRFTHCKGARNHWKFRKVLVPPFWILSKKVQSWLLRKP